jgi:hypothetical protein
MLNSIKNIVNPDVVLNIATGNNELLLKESSTGSKIKKLHIKQVPANAFAFTLDHQPGGAANRWFKQLSCYVDSRNNKGVNRGCDLVLVIPKEIETIILVFDLKSKKPKHKDTKKQLINSELYVRYLVSLIREYYKIDTSHIFYKKAIVTTAEKRGIPKVMTYRPNERKIPINSFYTHPVRVNNRKEASVCLGALIK